jgi:stage III sporulation protein AH
MKKLLFSNQVIITGLAIMIAIVGYLNFSSNSKDIGISGEFFEANEEVVAEKTEQKKVDLKKEDEESIDNEKQNPGEAVMSSSNIKLDYFYTVKLDREQTRAKSKDELLKIAENKAIKEDERQMAVDKIVELTANAEKENASELMLEAKGFEKTVVSLVDGKVDVLVNKKKLTSEEVAQIVDIVNRKTGVDISKIVVTPIQ